MVPLISTDSPLIGLSDLFAVVALLALGSVALALGGLDTGTAFGGMGASRELTVLALVEPTILVSIFALSVRVGSTDLGAIVTYAVRDPLAVFSPVSLLAAAALAIVTIAETGRVPVDNPATHLELTMIHEAMVLEYAGPDLALIEWASAARLSVLLGLLAGLFTPWGIATAGAAQRPCWWPSSSWSSRWGCWAPCSRRARCSWPSSGCSGCPNCWPGPSSWRCSPSPPPSSWPEDDMSDSLYVLLLDLTCGAFLLAGVLVLWRRDLAAIVGLFTLQGIALAALVVVLGVHQREAELVVVGLAVGALRAGLLPYLMRRALVAGGEVRETRPLVNVSASLLVTALMAMLAYAVSQPLIRLSPTPATQAVPIALTVLLVGFFVLISRRRALSQVVGFLLMDNAITATAFLTTSGVPLVVELGVSLDVLLAVLVLQVLTMRMRAAFGGTDLDELRELHD